MCFESGRDHKPKNTGDFRNWKRQKHGFALEPPERNAGLLAF